MPLSPSDPLYPGNTEVLPIEYTILLAIAAMDLIRKPEDEYCCGTLMRRVGTVGYDEDGTIVLYQCETCGAVML